MNRAPCPSSSFRFVSELIIAGAIAMVLWPALFFARAQAPGESAVAEAKTTKTPFGKLEAKMAGASKTINFAKGPVTQVVDLAVSNKGTGALHANVSTSTDASVFVNQAADVLIEPKAEATFPVTFAPPSAGKYSATITVNSSAGDVIKGKTSLTVRLKGSAKGSPAGLTPTPTPTPTSMATPSGTPTPGMGNVSLSGVVQSGKTAVCNSTVTIWSAGGSGNGSFASIITDAGTDSGGNFNLNFNCPGANVEMYAIAVGGEAGTCSGSNSALH